MMTNLLSEIAACSNCPLHSSCLPLPPAGSDKAAIMMVGERPDSEADLMREPFAGREGRLLDRLLKEAGLAREEVFLTYVVKCASKEEPSESTIATCKSWLWKEIQALRPRVIVTLGKLPTRLLLKLKKSVALKEVVGRFERVEFMTALVAPWFHPAYILQRGKKVDAATVAFFKEVKEKSASVNTSLDVLAVDSGTHQGRDSAK